MSLVIVPDEEVTKQCFYFIRHGEGSRGMCIPVTSALCSVLEVEVNEPYLEGSAARVLNFHPLVKPTPFGPGQLEGEAITAWKEFENISL